MNSIIKMNFNFTTSIYSYLLTSSLDQVISELNFDLWCNLLYYLCIQYAAYDIKRAYGTTGTVFLELKYLLISTDWTEGVIFRQIIEF